MMQEGRRDYTHFAYLVNILRMLLLYTVSINTIALATGVDMAVVKFTSPAELSMLMACCAAW